MDKLLKLHSATTLENTPPVLPGRIPQADKCESDLHIGLFFDGTGNNVDWDEATGCTGADGSQAARLKDSNIARLYSTYPLKPLSGYHPIYIAGVGTPFPPIGEIEPASLGMAAGEGGDGRINFGLLHVLNSLQTAISPDGQPAYNEDLLTALCRNGKRPKHHHRGQVYYGPLSQPGDAAVLRSVGMDDQGGLLCSSDGSRAHAAAFYKRETARIAELIRNTRKPRIVEIFIDVFGFSRGAAQARVCCSWLNDMFDGDRLCGVPASIRMLGIFDSVASVGIPNSPSITHNLTNGHMAWAKPEWLRVPPIVRHCVHYVALHENRASFPVEHITLPDGSLPPGCHELGFPGMHSDVGGGYLPEDQGRGRITGPASARDCEKLSQIPLNRMFDAARAAGVPLDKDAAASQSTTGTDLFAIDAGLEKAYAAFVAASGPEPRRPREWLLSYLAWRYQALSDYPHLSWRQRANATDRDDLLGANAILAADIKALDGTDEFWEIVSGAALPFSPFWETRQERVRKLAPEARTILQHIRSMPPVSQAEATLFAVYAHDSFAGFRPFDAPIELAFCMDLPGSWEAEGYLRYRRFYSGDNDALVFNMPEATEGLIGSGARASQPSQQVRRTQERSQDSHV